jgi:HEAT repeat protein
MYHMYQPSPGGGFRVGMASTKFLDDEVIEALGKALPQAMALPDVRRLTGQLVSDLVQTGSSAAYTMLSELLEQSGEPGLRRAIVTQLGRRATEPRVRSILEKVSSGDSDPQVRQAASQALSVAPTTSLQPPSGIRP